MLKYIFMKRAFSISLLVILHIHGLAQSPFSFQNKSIAPGTKSHIKVPVRSDNDSTFVPVTIFHGVKSGPVLGITAGVHGYEYPPILAAQELNRKIDPQKLSGTVILVQLANVPAFLGRSPYVNPMDGKNLNRSFPGDPNGTITQRIAHMITSDIITKSDFFVDMHAGDAPEDLRAYNAWYQSDALPEVSKKGKEMALAMGFDYSIIFNIKQERLKTPSIYCSQEAFHRKIPSVDIECGRLGIPGKVETKRIVDGMISLLKHLQMFDGISSESKIKPTIIAKRVSLKSKSTGLFYTEKKAGDLIKKGELMGYTTDFFGNTLEKIIASESGVILYMIGTPPINKDETLMSVGVLPE